MASGRETPLGLRSLNGAFDDAALSPSLAQTPLAQAQVAEAVQAAQAAAQAAQAAALAVQTLGAQVQATQAEVQQLRFAFNRMQPAPAPAAPAHVHAPPMGPAGPSLPHSILKALKPPVFCGLDKEDLPPYAYRQFVEFEAAAHKYMRVNGLEPEDPSASEHCKATMSIMLQREAEAAMHQFTRQKPHASYSELLQFLTDKYMPRETCKAAELAMQTMRWDNRKKGISLRAYLEQFMQYKAVAERQLTLDADQVWRWFMSALSPAHRQHVTLMQSAARLVGKSVSMLEVIQTLVEVSGEQSIHALGSASSSGPMPMDLSQLSISHGEDGSITIAPLRGERGGERGRSPSRPDGDWRGDRDRGRSSGSWRGSGPDWPTWGGGRGGGYSGGGGYGGRREQSAPPRLEQLVKDPRWPSEVKRTQQEVDEAFSKGRSQWSMVKVVAACLCMRAGMHWERRWSRCN